MKVVRSNINDTLVLIESIEEPIELLGEDTSLPQIMATGITKDIKDAYLKAKELISFIAGDFGNKLQILPGDIKPSKFEFEFSMGFSSELKAWILSGKANAGFKVTLTWE